MPFSDLELVTIRVNASFVPSACSFQNYTDYFKCIAAKGEDYAPCKQFKRAYNSLCPSASSLVTALCIVRFS